ncbi:alpha-catulin isoform X2 [Drosophila innubila]|uniref:alpha-catulin isoform X2 n=1 Tax=Drosophila innubila TaxID=198719 RepID=UPI00148BCE5F|nr:alpha-catulin isoform X2 [Drosophila innubila]
MDLIHFVIKDSIFDSAKHMAFRNARCNSNYENESIYTTIKRIINLIKRYKLQTSQYDCNSNNEGNNDPDAFYSLFNDEHWKSDIYHKDKNLAPVASGHMIKNMNLKKNFTYESLDLRDELSMAFDKLFEKAHDFTDSPYISHDHRKNILTYCDNCKLEFDMYLNHLIKDQHDNMGARVQVQGREPEMSMLASLEELCKQLVISVSSQIADFNESLKLCTKIVKSFHVLAVTHDLENLNQCSTKFHDCCDHIFDICKLLQHIAPTERLQVHAKCLAINLRIYGPQVFIAAKILWKYTNSSAANENFESFLDMWKWLISEISPDITTASQLIDGFYNHLPPTVILNERLYTSGSILNDFIGSFTKNILFSLSTRNVNPDQIHKFPKRNLDSIGGGHLIKRTANNELQAI